MVDIVLVAVLQIVQALFDNMRLTRNSFLVIVVFLLIFIGGGIWLYSIRASKTNTRSQEQMQNGSQNNQEDVAAINGYSVSDSAQQVEIVSTDENALKIVLEEGEQFIEDDGSYEELQRINALKDAREETSSEESPSLPDTNQDTSSQVTADDADGDGLTLEQEMQSGTDANNPDTDGDGLTDGDELRLYNTDPKRFDTDGDGLTDGEEVTVYGTRPTISDTDGDGYSDGTEVDAGYNPLGEGMR